MTDYGSHGQGGWPTQPSAHSGHGGDGGYGPVPDGYGPPRRRRRRRRRGPVALLVVLILILVILGVGDQIAKSYAQNRIAQQIQTSGDLSAKPSVSIEGWPFLTQVASHDIKAIDITGNDVTANSGKLPFSYTAKATGVHPNSSFNGATVDQINGQALITFASVAGLLGLPGGSVTLQADPAAGANGIKASSDLGSLTGTVKLASPNEIDVNLNSGTGLASLFNGLSGNSIKIQIPKLPAGLVVKSVSVNNQGIVAAASASNTTLTE